MSERATAPKGCRPADPAAVSLGRGTPLGSTARRSLEATFRTPLDHLQVHTDSHALAHLGSSRGAAIGNHLLVRPEDAGGTTLAAHLLLAHEVAHSLQQSPSGPDSPVGQAEADADRATVAAALFVLGLGERPAVQARTGLRLSRCDNLFKSDYDIGEEQYARMKTRAAEVRAAALATGSTGVTPKMVAAILYAEMASRNNYIGSVGDGLGRDSSLGWGQMKTSTALMALGDIPLISAPSNTGSAREAATDRVAAAYAGVSNPRRNAVQTMLADPGENIILVAKWLATLKNRPNRYPTMTAREFGSDEHAVAIIATEYNAGPTDTPADRAVPSEYGEAIWKTMASSKFNSFKL